MYRFGGDFLDAIDKINAILKERGMTGADLSREIGVSTAVYSQWNKKKTKPSNKNLLKVADALEVPVSELVALGQKESSPQIGELTEDELRLIMAYRAASEKKRANLLGLLEN